jgi:hypothetical protein
MFKQEETAPSKNIILKKLDRASWNDFPVDTKVHGINGGYYVRVLTGWKWYGSGSVFPRPAADWSKIELPFSEEEVKKSYEEVFGLEEAIGLFTNCKHEKNENLDPTLGIKVGCKHCGMFILL